MKLQREAGRRGYSVAELVVAAGIMMVAMGGVMTAVIAMRRSVDATNHYILETNNSNRLLDYVGMDLARAVRVGQLVGSTNTPFKNQTNFMVTEANTLTI